MIVACLGYGVVGKGVVEILQNDCRFQVKKILVKEAKECILPQCTTDFNEILEDDEIDAVVEMMGGIDFAYFCIKNAMLKKKHVVTSNKAVVAAHYQELLELAEKQSVHFRFEAAVGGGIPWIHTLLQQVRFREIEKIEGIFNGTTNYIFDQMHSTHQNYPQILKEAQDLGYAEADPSADVDGADALRKLMISTSIAFKSVTDIHSFHSYSMRNVQLKDILYFESKGLRCRYYARCIKKDQRYFGSVEPAVFDEASLPASIKTNNNLTVLSQTTLGSLSLIGQGAGRYPTANAVVQDIADILENRNSAIEYSNILKSDDEMLEDAICVCTDNKGIKVFEEVLIKTETIDGRVYGWTKPLVSSLKKTLVQNASERDPLMFYAVMMK